MNSLENFRERFEALGQETEQLKHQTQVLEAHPQVCQRRRRWRRGIAYGVVLLSMLVLALSSGKAEEVGLIPTAGGRYVPGFFAQAGLPLVYVGQGQAAWFTFDLSPLADARVHAMTFSFTQVDTTNPHTFPLTINIYDVTTPFDRLIVDRIPIDAEGEQIAEDLHTGKVYASFVVTAAGEGTHYHIALNNDAINDLQAAIDRGDQFFSIGLANPNFIATGYFKLINATLSVSFDIPLEVAIDIKPGEFPNPINPKNEGKIPVAILTTDTFDAATVDSTTVLFGATGKEAAPVQAALEDVDGDGDTDMILHFNTQDTGIQCRETSASHTGKTVSGQVIEGSDAITTVGCR
jgi:hypothetical protein